MHLHVHEIVSACKGKLLDGTAHEAPITAVCIDTRKITPGALFVPLKGERVDGHEFIKQAETAGASCVLTERVSFPEAETLQIPAILVNSTRQALMDLAAYYRNKHDVKVIAVTGSAGKTTTKEMMACLFAQRFKTKKTMGNFNNDIGLPLSIFQLEEDTQVLVLEMGMNHANEITELSKTGAPDMVLITHIGDAHIENFENREGILHAKLEITDGLKSGGTVILNGDDPLLTGPITAEKVRPFKTLYPSSENIISTEPNGLTSTHCHFRIQDKDIYLTIPLPGNHMVMNALLAVTAAVEMGLNPGEIANGFDAMEVPGGRLSVFKSDGITVINDAYNANPASMMEAIKVLMHDTPETKPTRRVCILGDMNELGHVSEDRHRELGIYTAGSGIDLLVTIGPMAKWLHEGYLSATERVFSALYFPDVQSFLPQISTLLFPGDIVLIKASRGMAFEQIVTELNRVANP